MLASIPGQKRRSLIDAISKWWSDWTKRRSAQLELSCCAEEELKRTAKDLGMSTEEFHQLVSRGPDEANLLLRRMAALDLDRSEVSQTEPRVFQDLQRVCALCESRRRCVRDLEQNSADPVWQNYCPNVETLKALNALPWMSRREW
jgi:hypothetical protein